jgi:hypothetical protein
VDYSLVLARQLAREGMALDAFIVNRVQQRAGEPAPLALASALAQRLGTEAVEGDLLAKIERVVTLQNDAARRDSERTGGIERELSNLGAKRSPPLIALPELRGNINGVEALTQIARAMAS